MLMHMEYAQQLGRYMYVFIHYELEQIYLCCATTRRKSNAPYRIQYCSTGNQYSYSQCYTVDVHTDISVVYIRYSGCVYVCNANTAPACMAYRSGTPPTIRIREDAVITSRLGIAGAGQVLLAGNCMRRESKHKCACTRPASAILVHYTVVSAATRTIHVYSP